MRSTPDGQHEWLGIATEHLVSAGGKRIRPAVSLLAAGIFDVNLDRAVSLAAGVEMLHTATLVHDDLIDQANTRRGAPTLNAVSGGDAAVLVGDYLFARAANLVAQTDHVTVMDEFAKTLMVILNGEVEQRFSRWRIDRTAYWARIYAKTAALFVLAAHAAAILGEANETGRLALVEYGRSAGMAFQIIDDVLDYTADSGKLGKPAGSDLRQGIITLPMIHYAENHPEDVDVAALFSALDGEHESAARLIEKVRLSDSIEAALKEALAQIDRAHRAIAGLPASIYTRALHDLANTVVERAV
jgi:geranylgeranyl pyrophosphate synthase